MAGPLRVLIVEDSEDDAALVVSELERAGFDVISETVETAPALREALARAAWDCVVSDFSMPELDGWRALEVVRQTARDLPFIIVSGSVGEETAADLMRAGATDFVLKDRLARFAPAMQREVRELRNRQEAAQAHHALAVAQEALARGALLDQILQRMPAGVIVAEAPSGQLLLTNRQAAELYGLPSVPRTISDRVAAVQAQHPDGRPYLEEEYPLIRALAGEVVTGEQLSMRRGDGPRITVLVNAAPIRDEGGTIILAVLALVDITAFREAEEARVRLAETLTSEIAHRTKNNLAIVAGLLQLQLLRGPNPDAHADMLRDAITRITSFAALHEQMYQRSAGTIELLDALRRIAEVDKQTLSAGEAIVTVEGEPVEFPASVATNLCVMMNELLTNAIKHGEAHGGVHRIEVHVTREGGRLVLSVWNSHSVVPAGFDARAEGRTGLGLVHAIVEDQYGGSFSLEPARGGTLARIVLDETRLPTQ